MAHTMAGTWVPRPPNIASGLPGKGQVAGAENRPPTRSRTGCPWHRRAVGTAGPARASCPAASSPSWACRLLLRVSPTATTAAGCHAGADPALNARPRSLPSWHPHWEAGAPAAPTSPARAVAGPTSPCHTHSQSPTPPRSRRQSRSRPAPRPPPGVVALPRPCPHGVLSPGPPREPANSRSPVRSPPVREPSAASSLTQNKSQIPRGARGPPVRSPTSDLGASPTPKSPRWCLLSLTSPRPPFAPVFFLPKGDPRPWTPRGAGLAPRRQPPPEAASAGPAAGLSLPHPSCSFSAAFSTSDTHRVCSLRIPSVYRLFSRSDVNTTWAGKFSACVVHTAFSEPGRVWQGTDAN